MEAVLESYNLAFMVLQDIPWLTAFLDNLLDSINEESYKWDWLNAQICSFIILIVLLVSWPTFDISPVLGRFGSCWARYTIGWLLWSGRDLKLPCNNLNQVSLHLWRSLLIKCRSCNRRLCTRARRLHPKTLLFCFCQSYPLGIAPSTLPWSPQEGWWSSHGRI